MSRQWRCTTWRGSQDEIIRTGPSSSRRSAFAWPRTSASPAPAGGCPRPSIAWSIRGRPARWLGLLEQAEAIGGLPPTRALWEDRAHYLALLGKQEEARAARRRAEQTPAASARDHYLLATAWARKRTRDDYTRAIAELDQAIKLNPRDYWSSVQRGVCELELGNLVAAAGDFGKCIGLWPDFAWGYFNRGCVLDREGKKTEAVDDYAAALTCDPDLVPAYINRGLVLLELKRYSQALEDFDRAAKLGSDVWPSRQAEARRSRRWDGSRKPTPRSSSPCPVPRPWTRRHGSEFSGTTRSPLPNVRPRRPSAFSRPSSRQARAIPRPSTAARCWQRARAVSLRPSIILTSHSRPSPDYLEARRYRAVILRAHRRVASCRRGHQSLPPARSSRRQHALHRRLRRRGLNSRQRPDPSTTGLAVEFLKRARICGEDISKARTDPDLDPIRQSPGFQRLLEGLAVSPPQRSS